jgi:hypothetical protein
MERLVNIDSTVSQLWNPITLMDLEDGGDVFFETSVLTSATKCNVQKITVLAVYSQLLFWSNIILNGLFLEFTGKQFVL